MKLSPAIFSGDNVNGRQKRLHFFSFGNREVCTSLNHLLYHRKTARFFTLRN